MGVFAIIALCLAAISIYGVLTYLVSTHTQEIGIRMALGADRQAVIRLVMHHSWVLVGIGLGLGLLAAAGGGRYLQNLLFEVTPFDVFTFSAASLLIGGIATLASWLPARRATKVDPLVALRCE